MDVNNWETAMRRFRDFLPIALLTLAVGLSGGTSLAQESFPSRVVKVIVPFPPGSTLDALTRIVTDQLAQKWGQPVVIENVSGGGGNIGTERFARSTPDGYTLLFAPPGPFTVNPLLYADVNFDPAKFAAVSLLAKVPNVLLTKNSIGATTAPELIAFAKANPGKLTYATQGVGSTAFLTAKLFEARAGIEMVHVPYRGAGPALSDVVAGHVDMMFDTIVTSLPLHRSGKAKILAIANDERSRALPDLPTIAESALPGFRSASWFAVATPPGTPGAITERISRDIADLIRRPEVDARLRELQLDPLGSTPEEAVKFFAGETALWSKVIKDANVKPQ
jgi:tripartite-type tricarboxylate transporter receptor subunit TctC